MRDYATDITRSIGIRPADILRLWIAHGLDRLPGQLPDVEPLAELTVIALPAALMQRVRRAMSVHEVSAYLVTSIALRCGVYDVDPSSRGSKDRLGPALRAIMLEA